MTTPTMREALERCCIALAANGAPNCEAAKEARAALAADPTPELIAALEDIGE